MGDLKLILLSICVTDPPKAFSRTSQLSWNQTFFSIGEELYL